MASLNENRNFTMVLCPLHTFMIVLYVFYPPLSRFCKRDSNRERKLFPRCAFAHGSRSTAYELDIS